MIRLWISRTGATPVREQLSAQLLPGILSGQLRTGQRLPSVRELARRLRIHANTVSAVYQDLAQRGWVEARRGSGVFVRNAKAAGDGQAGLSSFVSAWLQQARMLGYSLQDLRGELERVGNPQAEQWLVVVDPDIDLAEIMAAEIRENVKRPVAISGITRLALPPNALALVNAGHSEHVLPLLGGVPCHHIRLNSMQAMISNTPRPAGPVLIAIVSRSTRVLEWAATLLCGLGFGRDSLLLRNPAEPHWQQGLEACEIVGADICSARILPDNITPVVFHVIAEESMDEIRRLVTAPKVS